MSDRLLIIGGSHPTAVGQSLFHAARTSGFTADYLDADRAYDAPPLLRALWWRLADKRPVRMGRFNQKIITRCAQSKATHVICAGNLPLIRSTVQTLVGTGVHVCAWLTDDPWNPAHHARWLMNALPAYSKVWTPRRANLDELEALNPDHVGWLPFGYDQRFFHPVRPLDEVPDHFEYDVFFAGGGDLDRVPFMAELAERGLNLGLFGGFWDRYPATRPLFRGYAAPTDLAKMIDQSRSHLCLVRRANRDGHCMRTFELAASAACILAEDTPEHREIFGSDSVLYFRTTVEAATHALEVRRTPELRQQLRTSVHRRIMGGAHTYSDRLLSLLDRS